MNSMAHTAAAKLPRHWSGRRASFARPDPFWGCGLALLLALSAVGQTPPPGQSADLAAAAAAEKSGNYQDAARGYRQFLSTITPATPAPLVVETRTRLATVLFMLHRYRESMDVLDPLGFPPSGRSNPIAKTPPQRANSAAIPAQAWLVRGLDELELNQLPDAIRSLRRTLALDQSSGTARLALGDALARNGELEEAAEAYRQQLQRAPDTVDAWYKLGSVYQELAGKLAAELTQKQGNSILAIQLSAEESLDRGDYWGAAKELFPLIQRASSSDQAGSKPPASAFQPGLHATFGTALLQLGYPRAAEREFETELSQDFDSLPAQLGMAEIEALNLHWDAALGTFGRLITLYPRGLARQLESPPATLLAEAKKKQQLSLPTQLAESPAGKLWDQWLASGGLESVPRSGSSGRPCSPPPSRQELLPGYWISEACSSDLVNKIRAQENPSPSERAKLAEAEYRLGEYQSAAEGSRALLRGAAGDPWAYYWLVKSYSALAGTCFDKLAEVGPDSARVHEILARYHSERQQLAAARDEYQAALRLDPSLPDLHLGLGTVYWQSGDWSRAETELTKALELSPASAVAAYELGDCFVQQHQWSAAASPLERALADPAVQRPARLDLAKAEAESGHSDSAIKNLNLLAADDADGSVHHRLAMVYRKIGDSAKARDAFAQSEALHKASDQLDQSRIEALERESEGSPTPAPSSSSPQ
jgi:tetratricopeptide (TPR) repeat protein